MAYEDVLIKNIRILAKSTYYQTMFNQAKDLGFALFKNNRDLTTIQIIFLNYLNFYSTLYTDIYLGEIDDEVLQDSMCEDAYYYYKKMSKDKKKKEKSEPQVKKIEPEKGKSFSWVFQTKGKP